MKIVDALDELRRYVDRFDRQGDAAKALGVSLPYLSDMLHGNRNISERVLSKLKLRRVVVK